jgi:hypothetical protein
VSGGSERWETGGILTNLGVRQFELSDHPLSPAHDDSHGDDTEDTGDHTQRAQHKGQGQDTQTELGFDHEHRSAEPSELRSAANPLGHTDNVLTAL